MSEATKQKWARHEHGNHYVLQGDSLTPIGMFLKAEHAEQAVRAVNTYDEREALIRHLMCALEHIVTHQQTAGGGLADLSTTRRIAQTALNKANEVMGGGE